MSLRLWHPISSAPLSMAIETKIDDEHGSRNEQVLIGTQRAPECRVMWWLDDMSMYVYYAPTHWRHIETAA